MTNEQYREAAREQYGGGDAGIEIDEGAVVSRGSDPGAYVAAWVWVENPDGIASEDDDQEDETAPSVQVPAPAPES